MDTALLSKMERGDRQFRKEEIIELSKIFHQNEQELLTIWLADKILKATEGESYIPEALNLALQTYQQSM